MTTKLKIIMGFTIVLLALVAVAVIGYRGLGGATTSFQYYNRLALMNVNLSDTTAEVWAQAYNLERFMATREAKHIDEAAERLKKIVEMGTTLSAYIKIPERQAVANKMISQSKEYLVLLAEIKNNMLTWQKAYDEVLYPSVSKLQQMTEAIGAQATRTENLPVLSELNEAWVCVNRISYRLTRFAEAASAQNADSLGKAIVEMQPVLTGMRQIMTSELAQKDFAQFKGLYDAVAKTFETQKGFALKALADVEKSSTLDASLMECVSSLNKDVDSDMLETSDSTLAANRSSQNFMLVASLIGVAVGSGFALFIILGLIRILNSVSSYASAVAGGDFAYDPNITEGGEIGTMVSALRRIPATLSDTIKECRAASNKIACGLFRTRLAEQSFSGGFKDLAGAVNSMGESYTKVIDELPVSIMAADTSRRIQFLNAMAQKLAGGNSIGEVAESRLKIAESASTSDGEIAVSTPQGLVYLALSKLPLYDLSGKPAGGMDIITDITQIKQQQITMAEVARQAMAISDRVAAASEELSAQVEQVSQGSEVQRDRVASTASAMTEMNATVLEVARSAGEASEQSDNTRANAEQGAALVNRVVSAINSVNQVAVRLQENMDSLGKQAENIGGVMNVISDIADQTNLLALNAAIEAARAGEAGRGFAVVADEVRKLAEKTMTATQEVGSSITAVQQSAQANITEVNRAVEGVTEATQLANSSGEALQGIVGLARATSSVVTSIATAAEEQSATSEEITHAIDEINRIVAETSEGMIQSSQAVQDLSSMAQELKAVLDSLR